MMTMQPPPDRFLVIYMNHSNAGFFSYLTFTLNQLRYAEAAGLVPVVHFGPRSGGGRNAFHDPRLGENTWDYYFEPVAGVTYLELCSRLADPCDAMTTDRIVMLDPQFLWYLHAYDPAGIYNYPYGHFRSLPAEALDAWYTAQRAKARHYLRKYVRPKPHILARVETFWAAHLQGHDVVGVHMRGSDKGAADAAPELSRIVEPDEYFPHIDRFLDGAEGGRIFLATEQAQFVARTRARYGKRLMTREVIRTSGFGPFSNPFQTPAGSGYAKGEEVLIDCLLLSRSDWLLRCTSAVGEYAVYFNETLRDLNLNRPPARGAGAEGAPDQRATAAKRLVGAPAYVTEKRRFASFFGPGRLFEGAILINLDDRIDRLERSISELARHGVADRVTRLSAFRHENGMYGCSVSHLEAVRYARWKGWRSVLVLEDDIRFSESFREDAPAALCDLAGRDWGLFQFGAMVEPRGLELVSASLFRYRHGHAAHALAVHARCFDFLIGDYVCELDRGNWDLRMHVPFDEYVNNRLTYYFPAFGSRKLLISQHPGRSDTWNCVVHYRALMESRYALLQAS
jgi:hypothetical protein